MFGPHESGPFLRLLFVNNKQILRGVPPVNHPSTLFVSSSTLDSPVILSLSQCLCIYQSANDFESSPSLLIYPFLFDLQVSFPLIALILSCLSFGSFL